MSDSQTIWMILWDRATSVQGPFEISDIVPEVSRRLDQDEKTAQKLILNLLAEVERMPEGERYFRVEGYAVVPLAEFFHAPKDQRAALDAYPFEL